MKKYLAPLILSCAIGTALASDKEYAGVAVAVPLTFDAVGVQTYYRKDYAEVRLGLDTRLFFQVGAGLVGGDGHPGAGSAGIAYSSARNNVVPYIAMSYAFQNNNAEIGAISYGADEPTTYLFAGGRFMQDHEGGNNAASNRDAGGGNTGGDDNSGGDNGSGQGGDNRSGLGDGSNPGNSEQDNGGTDNPNNS